ncbi:MAG: hypothetical protein IJY15_11835 [Thermoguttaceae bacterium]|nr:hypothetical protein [Thermoguttaceae bacterium]
MNDKEKASRVKREESAKRGEKIDKVKSEGKARRSTGTGRTSDKVGIGKRRRKV